MDRCRYNDLTAFLRSFLCERGVPTGLSPGVVLNVIIFFEQMRIVAHPPSCYRFAHPSPLLNKRPAHWPQTPGQWLGPSHTPPPRYFSLRQGLFFRGGPLRRERLVVEGGGGEALSASCWPGGGAAAGGKGAPRGAGGSRCGRRLALRCSLLPVTGLQKKPNKTPR